MDRPSFETAEAHATPTVRQFSIFLEDRVGQLVRLTRVFETTDVHILGLSMAHTGDCAIIRLIVDQPDLGYDMIATAGFPLCETEVLAISLPVGKRGLLSIWTALLSAEINITYAYPLFSRPKGRACIALQADDIEAAYRSLIRRDFYMLDESDLRTGF